MTARRVLIAATASTLFVISHAVVLHQLRWREVLREIDGQIAALEQDLDLGPRSW